MGDKIRKLTTMQTAPAFAKTEHTVVNVGNAEVPRLITCVKASQGFDWNLGMSRFNSTFAVCDSSCPFPHAAWRGALAPFHAPAELVCVCIESIRPIRALI